MAANRRKTVEYAFPTRITQLATNTTLGTSTRHDTSAITLNLPETTSRNFLSVRLVATYTTEWITVTPNVTGWRMGIKLGAAATVDTDRAGISTMLTGSKNVFDAVDLDVTSYFNSNFGAGASQTCVASLAVSSSVAANINNVTFKLVITYELDATAHTTRIKTIRVPIQSQISTLTAAQQEIGADGTNPAPANQIPALDTFLPEASKVYRQIFLELTANTGSIAATNFTPFVQIDATAEVARATLDQTDFTLCPWRDIYDLTGLIATNTAHALKLRCDLTARLCFAGAVLVVTYEYDVTATTSIMCEAMVPLSPSVNDANDPQAVNTFTTNIAADASLWVAMLNVQESNPVISQSAAMLIDLRNSTSTTHIVRAATQTYRTYTPVAASGEGPFIHRCDQGSGWAIVRGDNRLTFNFYSNSNSARATIIGYALINYTADKPADPDAANHPVNYFGNSYGVAANLVIDVPAGTARVPVLGSPYKLSGVLLASIIRGNSAQPNGQFYIAQLAGELDQQGWVNGGPQGTVVSVQSVQQLSAFSRAFNADSLHTGKLNPETDRRVARYSQTVTHLSSWSWWLTYHQITFTVAGTLTIDGAAAANGKVIRVWAYDAGGVAELVTSGVTAGGAGAFSIAVLDNTRTYFVTHQNGADSGASAALTPGGAFAIVIRAAAGFPDVTITSAPAVSTTATTASFSFTVSPGAAEYSVDGSAFAPAVSPINLAGLAVGAHTITIRSTTDNTHLQSFAWSVVAAVTAPISGNTTTSEAVRDQILSVIEALIPAALPNSAPGNRFRRYLNEGGANFMAWADARPDGAFRRVQVRSTLDILSDVADIYVEARLVTFRIIVAYPQNARTGGKNALDRDDAMSSDQRQIEQAVGLPAFGNFPNASWISATPGQRVEGKTCDFLVIDQTMRFYRSFP